MLHLVVRTVTGRLYPLNAKLNPICHLLALLGAHHILHISRISVKPSSEFVAHACHYHIYRVSQEERTKLRESVPYVKLY